MKTSSGSVDETDRQSMLPPRSRRARKKSETRARLVEEGLALFIKRGYAETRVEEITEAADVAKGTFFNYFGSKQGLLTAYREDRLAEVLAEVTRLEREDLGPVLRLRRFFTRFAAMIEREGERYRMLTVHLLTPPLALDPGDAGRRVFNFYRATVAVGVERGELRRSLDRDSAVAVIASQWAGAVIEWAHSGADRPLGPLFSRRLDLLLEGMAASESGVT